jgi:hypothetical protein
MKFEDRMMINECRMIKLETPNFLNHHSSFDVRYSNLKLE